MRCPYCGETDETGYLRIDDTDFEGGNALSLTIVCENCGARCAAAATLQDNPNWTKRGD